MGHLLSFPSKMNLNAWNAGFFSLLLGFGSCLEVHHMSPHLLFELKERGIVRLEGEACRFREAWGKGSGISSQTFWPEDLQD